MDSLGNTELEESSLYSNGKIIILSTGKKVLLRERFTMPEQEDKVYHTIKKNETLDSIAYKYYNSLVNDSSLYWWIIADYNKIHFPLDISNKVGEKIVIPPFHKVRVFL